MDNNQKSPLRIVLCETCGGKNPACSACRGERILGVLGPLVLRFNLPLSLFATSQRKLNRTVERLIDLALIILAVFGLAALIWQVGFHSLENVLSQKSFAWLIFWLSLLGSLFLYFRLKTREEKVQRIMRKQDLEKLTLIPEQFSWPELLSLPKINQSAVVQVMKPEVIAVLEDAYALAKSRGAAEVLPIHLLAALLNKKETMEMLSRLSFDYDQLTALVGRVLDKTLSTSNSETILSLATIEIIFQSYWQALQNSRSKIDIAEIFCAIAQPDSSAREVLLEMEMDYEKISRVAEWFNARRDIVASYRKLKNEARFKPKGTMNRAMTAVASPFLEKISVDLTYLASRNVLEICVNREDEMNAIFRSLEGGSGGVLLSGFDGVGKTTIINGLAQRMAAEEVPEVLQDKRLISLSVPSLVAGAAFGELEGRIQKVVTEISRAKNIVLVIENIHDLVGVTSEGGQTLDISDVLAQAMNQKLITVVATTTPDFLAEVIEKRSSLGNLLRAIPVSEVDEGNAIRICEIKALFIEGKQPIYFSYGAVEAAVKMSHRYIHDQYLPTKAISLLEEVAAQVKKERGEQNLVTAEDVNKLISEKTKIPVSRVSESDKAKLLNLEELIHGRIIGQEEAVKMVAKSLRRARAELRDQDRPIANLLFLGPTGVGKTELAKTVAQIYFGDEKNMIRLDMSEYQDQQSLERMLGGNKESGYLTEKVRRNPFSLLLLDELEKAHPDILNVFLQVMDDGRLTDGMGRTIDFTNIILIATSNAATPFVQTEINRGQSVEQIQKTLVEGELKKYFRPEFLNRFDGIIVFKPLTESEILQIAHLLLKEVKDQLAKKDITLEVTEEAVAELAQQGFDPQYGARPLRRVIQDQVDTALANYLLSGKIKRRDKVILDKGGEIRIEKGLEI